MSLQEKGWRFVLRDEPSRESGWMPPLSMKPGDIDCTDMDDEEFFLAVKEWERRNSLATN